MPSPTPKSDVSDFGSFHVPNSGRPELGGRGHNHARLSPETAALLRRLRALIGNAKSASVEVNTPGDAKAYEIKKVEWR